MTTTNGQVLKDRNDLFTDGAVLLSMKALLDGAYDNGLFLTPQEAVGVAISAAMAFAIETAGPGGEDKAMKMLDEVFADFAGEYRRQIAAGSIRGKGRGGFRRRLTREIAGFGGAGFDGS